MGSDTIDRPKVGPFKFRIRDFLAPHTFQGWPAIAMNPPFKLARAFIEKGLSEVKPGGIVAALTPISFLASQSRHDFFRAQEMERVIVLSRRPSMPDGDALLKGAVKRGGGKTNYCWLIFRNGGRSAAATVIDWGLAADSDDGGRSPGRIAPRIMSRRLGTNQRNNCLVDPYCALKYRAIILS